MNNVLQMLEHSAKIHPDKIAFKDVDEKISFSELLQLSKIGGSFLPSGPIAVYMKKSCQTLAVMLSAIQAGGFYSIIDLYMPKERKQKMCKLLQADMIVCDNEKYDEAKDIFEGYSIIKASDIFNCPINETKLKTVRLKHISTDILYCNFTSGSTGNPKGVLISHISVIDFIEVFTKTMGLKNSDVFANQAPFDFDVSVKDIYSTLFLGAQCLLIPRIYFTKPFMLMDFISTANILIWAVSALIFLNVTKALSYKKPNIRKIIYSGEIMPSQHIIKLKNNLPKTQFINVYGPSEITCNCTYYFLNKKDFSNYENIIGSAFSNRRVFLIDENENLISSPFTIGEICVSGVCLALGYLGGSNDAFHISKNGQRYYKTGDLAFFNEKGLLCIKGRKDFQIKRMGHRIELAEIENVAQNCNEVSRACAIYESEKLVLFFEGIQEEAILSEYLRKKLPFYMLPNIIIRKKTIPINKNGKIDRALLTKEVSCKNY